MKKVEEPIKVEVVEIVKSKCPLTHWSRRGVGIIRFDRCKKCEFYSNNGGHHCEWYEYRTEFVAKSSDHEDDISTYYWTIKCMNCDKPIHFSSGLSSLITGDKKKCSNCGLLHAYLDKEEDNDKWIRIFAVPVREYDNIKGEKPK